jgi:hypothetical protein
MKKPAPQHSHVSLINATRMNTPTKAAAQTITATPAITTVIIVSIISVFSFWQPTA